jgi:hypothetical protein
MELSNDDIKTIYRVSAARGLVKLKKSTTVVTVRYITVKKSQFLRLLLGDIGFIYPVMSMMVIGPSLPKLRQRRWSLMYCMMFIDST